MIILVITIVIMIILGGAIIISLNNSDIIRQAKETVEKSNVNQVQELATVAWTEAYINRDTNLQESVEKKLIAQGIKIENYNIKVTTSGVSVKNIGKWKQDGTVITNGEDTLYVGDYIDYVATGTDYTGTWQVLGVEYGELLITTTDGTYSNRYNAVALGGNTVEKAQQSYFTCIGQLNEVCEAYGNGIKASGARSIKIEDINRIAKIETNDEVSNPNYDLENGQRVEFYWNGTECPMYKNEEGNDYYMESHEFFIWLDEGSQTWKQALNPFDTITEKTPIIADDGSESVAKITQNDSGLYDESNLFGENSAAYKLLIANEKGNHLYWIASRFVTVSDRYVSYSLGAVLQKKVSSAMMLQSDGTWWSAAYCFRPVVSLEADTELQPGTQSNEWKIVK